jgi:hypothetical protein
VVDAENATVGPLELSAAGLRWTETENALPLAFIRDNQTQDLLLRLTNIEQELNQEPLRVTGLGPGSYNLTIDGTATGIFSADELSKGINLADYGTPMRRQSQEVSWLVRDRDEAHYIHLRMAVRAFDAGAQPGQPDVMDAFENSLEDAIYQTATPKPHVYEVSTVTTP